MPVTENAAPAKPLTMDALLAGAPELAAMPQVVMRVIDLSAKPNSTATDLERAISLDQGLSTKVLTLANSSYFGLPRRLSSLKEAIVFLGFKSVRNLAMAITTFTVFLGKSDSLSLTRRALWRHSLDTAQCARIVAGRLPAHIQSSFGSDEAFTCGLLHDIGKMIIDSQRPAQYMQIAEWCAARNLRFHEVELEVLPFGHSLIGAAMAGRWNLPPMLCEAVAFHHTPRAAEINPRLTATVSLANELAHHIEAGGSDEGELSSRVAEVLTPLHLSADALSSLAAACRAEMENGMAHMSFG